MAGILMKPGSRGEKTIDNSVYCTATGIVSVKKQPFQYCFAISPCLTFSRYPNAAVSTRERRVAPRVESVSLVHRNASTSRGGAGDPRALRPGHSMAASQVQRKRS